MNYSSLMVTVRKLVRTYTKQIILEPCIRTLRVFLATPVEYTVHYS